MRRYYIGRAAGASCLRSLNIDEPLVRQSSSNELYHTDALGSVLALTGQTGAVQTTYSYEAFGKTTVTGSSSNPFQYTGRENDGTGLYYYRARYYAPQLQRFLSEDPIRMEEEDGNLYQYVRNQPLIFIDPTGNVGKPQQLDSQHTVRIDNGIYNSQTGKIQEYPNAHVYNKAGNQVAKVQVDPTNPSGPPKVTSGSVSNSQITKLKPLLNKALKKLTGANSIIDVLGLLNKLNQIRKKSGDKEYCLFYDPVSGDFSVGQCDDEAI